MTRVIELSFSFKKSLLSDKSCIICNNFGVFTLGANCLTFLSWIHREYESNRLIPTPISYQADQLFYTMTVLVLDRISRRWRTDLSVRESTLHVGEQTTDETNAIPPFDTLKLKHVWIWFSQTGFNISIFIKVIYWRLSVLNLVKRKQKSTLPLASLSGCEN